MSGKLRALLAITLASIGLAAVASPASAVIAKFAAAKYPSILTAGQTGAHAFSVEAGQVKCLIAKASATLAAESPTWGAAEPVYDSCALEGVEATVAANGCAYTFRAGLSLEPGKSIGDMTITCPSVNKIVISVKTGCEIRISPSTEWVGFLTYKNAFADFSVPLNTEFAYWQNNKCAGVEGNYENGLITGEFKVQGNLGAVQIVP